VNHQTRIDDPEFALYAPLLAGLRERPLVRAEVSGLIDDAVRVWSKPGFETFLSLSSLRFEPFDYQVQAARTALRRMRGRAILADEVGLGKTIEAGLTLTELRLRGLADKILVIAPAGLVTQWREELERKFGVPTVTVGKDLAEAEKELGRPVVVASLAAARRAPLATALTSVEWDLLIVDEAHRVRNPRSASGKLVRELKSRHLLLLTATPVENRLQDLYEMISLVSPGLLGTAAQFRAAHGGAGTAAGTKPVAPVTPKNVAALRRRTSEVMIRHRRSEVSVLLPQRLAETLLIEPPPAEREWYADLGDRIRKEGREAAPARRLTLRSIARLAGSSPAAAVSSLSKAGWEDLAVRAQSLGGWPKGAVLLDQLRRHAGSGADSQPEKVLVFTAFRHTLDQLAALAADSGVRAAVYHGSLPRAEKERAIAAFRDETGVLLSTESAGEGRNLQFCHVMVNVDLPWNPMQIEQRLGRLHRVGQDRDVRLTNLVARGTIEEQVLRVLESKINLFELVVGELDMILGRVDDDFDFESTVFNTFVSSGDDTEFAERMDELGDGLARARTDYLASREAIDGLVAQADD
jgi:SNF2 family DNA or RNA helicase